MYKLFIKDFIDFYLALVIFIVLLPFMISVYFILYILIGSPMYYQKRPGYMNRPFEIYKFKTLKDKYCWNYKKNKNF